MKKIIVAIDGFSACGKSTLAKDLAAQVNYKYIDSGAMYRAIAYFAIHTLHCELTEGILSTQSLQSKLLNELQNINISFSHHPDGQHIMLNSVDIEQSIRHSIIGQNASVVATLKQVRNRLVAIQQQLGKDKAIVMDGRDIGTVVFPQAELKIFLTADFEIRVKRRYKQLYPDSPIKDDRLNQLRSSLKERDYRDTHRDESPLIQAPDAVLLDNSYMDKQQQLNILLDLFNQRIR